LNPQSVGCAHVLQSSTCTDGCIGETRLKLVVDALKSCNQWPLNHRQAWRALFTTLRMVGRPVLMAVWVAGSSCIWIGGWCLWISQSCGQNAYKPACDMLIFVRACRLILPYFAPCCTNLRCESRRSTGSVLTSVAATSCTCVPKACLHVR
jgi:hypothetical protein